MKHAVKESSNSMVAETKTLLMDPYYIRVALRKGFADSKQTKARTTSNGSSLAPLGSILDVALRKFRQILGTPWGMSFYLHELILLVMDVLPRGKCLLG